jgi:low temperature requirement protein LtrA
MTTNAGPQEPPVRTSSERATFLELFLDLVYVFALTRLSSRLVGDFTTQRRTIVTESGQTLLLLLALWLVWVLAARMTSAYDPRRPSIQLTVFMIMFGSMIIAVTLPHAFGARGLAFAVTYVTVQMLRPFLLWLVIRHRERLIHARALFWALLSAGPWIVGGAVVAQSPARGGLWTLAILLDYTGLTLGYPTPRLGRTRARDYSITATHLAERFQQFVIITLGEAILVMGMTYARKFDPDGVAPVALSFLTTVLIWRIYFYRAGTLLGAAIQAAARPARLGQSGIYTHLVMVAGIFVSGGGFALVIDRPYGHLDPAWLAAIFGGPALFLAGRSRFEYEVFARVSWSRVIALIALGALVPAMLPLPPVAAAGTATAVLAGVATRDALRSWRHPPEEPSPPPLRG